MNLAATDVKLRRISNDELRPPLSSPFYLNDRLIDPRTNQLYLHDESVSLQPKLMEVLLYLCQRTGEIVSGEALVSACWPNQYISDNPVHKCIAQLRKALGDSSRNSLFIKTVPRKGYTIVAKLEAATELPLSDAPSWSHGSPYPGVKPYGEEHESVFFGRDQVVYETLQWLQRPLLRNLDWLCIHAPEGAGKTSLLRAGLLPAVKQLVDKQGIAWLSYTALDLREESAAKLLGLLAGNGATLDRNLLFLDHFDHVFSESWSDQNRSDLWSSIESIDQCGKFKLVTLLASSQQLRLDQECPAELHRDDYSLPSFSQAEMLDIILRPMVSCNLHYQYDKNKREQLDLHLLQNWHEFNFPVGIVQETLHLLYQAQVDGEIGYQAYDELNGFIGCLCRRADVSLSAGDKKNIGRFKSLLYHLLSLKDSTEAVGGSETVPVAIAQEVLSAPLLSSLIKNGVLSLIASRGSLRVRFGYELLLYNWSITRDWISTHLLELYARHDLKVLCERWLYHDRNSEFLISSKEALLRLKVLSTHSHFSLGDNELLFIELSKSLVTKRYIYRAGFTAVMVFSVAALSWLSYSLNDTARALEKSKTSAENLLSFVLYDLEEKLTPLGKIELLDMVGKKALQYFENEGTQNLDNASRAQWVKALIILGEGQVKRGDLDQAKIYFEEAGESLVIQLQQYPNDVALLEQAMLTQYWLGYIPYDRSNYGAAKAHFKLYLNFAENLIAIDSDNENWILERSYALNNLGSIAFNESEVKLAEGYFLESSRLKSLVLANSPGDIDLQIDVADTLSWLASSQERMGDYNKAIASYQLALDLAQRTHLKFPENMDFAMDLAILANRVALSYHQLGDNLRALREAEKSRQLIDDLEKNDRENIDYKVEGLTNYWLLMKVHNSNDNIDLAMTYFSAALSQIEKLKYIDKYSHKVQRIEARLNKQKFLTMIFIKDMPAAVAAIRQSIILARPLAKKSEEVGYVSRVYLLDYLTLEYVLLRETKPKHLLDEIRNNYDFLNANLKSEFPESTMKSAFYRARLILYERDGKFNQESIGDLISIR